MRWEHFAYGADLGVRGYGRTPSEAFAGAALALTAAVTDPGLVEPRALRESADAPGAWAFGKA